MHVKPLRSELRVDVSGRGTPPGAVNGGGRRPLGAIAGNALRGRACPPPPLSLCPAKDDPAAFLDMCAVIKPGHVREKIALFAPDSASVRAPSTRAGKVKSSRRENGDAKRRRRSAGHKNLRRDAGASDRSWAEGAEPKVSVGAMVAFLERRRRSGGRHAGLPPLPEDPESVRVSDVVAKLECLQRRDGGGAFTTPRRWVGRLLLTAGPAASPPADARRDDPTQRSRSPPAGGAATPETPPSLGETEPPPGLLFLSAPSPPPPGVRWYESQAEAAAPDDFAQTRRRLGELLEPPATLATLPQDVLAGVFALLPTRSLAALKCACRYFKSLIESYGVRPADSLWVSDPRYRDDPCKKCKRRYGRGDASPCRWHHKPYCQALPFGPGFWLCCRRLRRDAPGCNVGLHDNRWVPAYVAGCRGSADD
ncbi:F-box only protein 34 [Hippocampus zosterae]|uniref:F-box only protein 34 n=1 Tax=Hippocampus zosterae TaxID=109293 RepID=UPI00223D3218|nr:F-box only protein 34 [Hippocampus zosterae]